MFLPAPGAVEKSRWLKAVRQPKPLNRDGYHCCQGKLTFKMADPVLSRSDKLRSQEKALPMMLAPWQDTWKINNVKAFIS